jgi:IclR family acetate operon transcriptional repressor
VCAASPLLDSRGVAVAAVSISGWANRMRTERVAPAVRTVGLALTRTLSGSTAGSRK